MASTLSDTECNLFVTLIKNKQHLGLLEREAEWLSNHHHCDEHLHKLGEDCNSCYSGDTISEKELNGKL